MTREEIASGGRSPMFGARASLPYGGTAGATGSPQSHERPENTDEHGVTTLRQTQTLALLGEAGTTGMTWFELGDRMGWHHGQSSNVLSVLHRAGQILALSDRRGRDASGRGKSTIYVLPEYVAGRHTREPGTTKGNRDLIEANAGLDRENALLNQRVIDLQAQVEELVQTLRSREGDLLQANSRYDQEHLARALAEQQSALAVEQMTRLDDERANAIRRASVIEAERESLIAEVERLTTVNHGLRTRHALMQMEPSEQALHARIAGRLNDPRIASAPDDQTIRVTLGLLRTFWMLAGRLMPDALPRREPAGESPAPEGPADSAPDADPAP